jgi:alkylhydroperoxidase/carboxymuconolactone decarboxylase family protein YurZ
VGDAAPTYGAQVDAAVDAGATAAEIVDVLAGVIPVVGRPCVVAATPKHALARVRPAGHPTWGSP